MKLVNVTTRTVYTALSGRLYPGETSSDGGPRRRRLQEALEEVVSACGSSLGVKLNAKEMALFSKLMDLDDKGNAFRKESLPSEVIEDPDGEKGADRQAAEAQANRIKSIEHANARSIAREAMINGEVDERTAATNDAVNSRKPVGPATLKGEKVSDADLKSPFEKIMEANARIESGKKPIDANEILDPIGAHAKGANGERAGDGHLGDSGADTSSEKSIGKDPDAVEHASGREDDGTRSADAEMPVPTAPERGGRMDEVAAEVAAKLATVGPSEAKRPQKPGKQEKAEKNEKTAKAGKPERSRKSK